jgi:TetR/AcrR family acrAB operon transcriptional repressor
MARKTKEDAQATNTALLDAAEKVFFEHGVAGTTLNDIAAYAGLTRGAVYWHFKDKADLLRAMFTRAMFPMEAMLDELERASGTDPLGALRAMCLQALTNLANSPDQQRVFSIMFHKCEHIGQLVEVLQDKHERHEECHWQIESVLQKAVTEGQLPKDTDVALANQIIKNFMVGTMSEWLFAPQSFDLNRCAPAMVHMMLAGLQAGAPRVVKEAQAA